VLSNIGNGGAMVDCGGGYFLTTNTANLWSMAAPWPFYG